MSGPDRTPEGDEIVAETLWLSFPEGDVAISMDATKFVAAMDRCQQSLDRLQGR